MWGKFRSEATFFNLAWIALGLLALFKVITFEAAIYGVIAPTAMMFHKALWDIWNDFSDRFPARSTDT